MEALLSQWKDVPRPVIGMLHLPPLPGSPRYGGEMQAVLDAVLRDAEALAAGGVHGLMLENFGDVPFYPGPVPAHVVAQVAVIAHELRWRMAGLPLGINLLRNDGCGALGVAHAAGAQFIRVNVLCGARVTDQGLVQGMAHELMRLRRELGAGDIRVLADVDVKHSAALAPRPLEEEVADILDRGLADALIVTGSGTGRQTSAEHLRAARVAAGGRKVLVGSGVTAQNLESYLPEADGFIVGTAFKRDGLVGQSVDSERVRAFVDRLAEA